MLLKQLLRRGQLALPEPLAVPDSASQFLRFETLGWAIPSEDTPRFCNCAKVRARWALEVQVNPYAGDEFKANQLVVRAETRFGVACIYPHAVCKLTGLFPPA